MEGIGPTTALGRLEVGGELYVTKKEKGGEGGGTS